MGFLFSTDFGSWLLPVAARSVLCSLSFHFPSPCSFTDLKILLTTGLGYGLPYIILNKVFFLAARFSLGGGFFTWWLVFRLATRFSLGGSVFSRLLGFLSASRFWLGGAVFSWGWGFFLARILVPGSYLSQPGVVCVPFLSFSSPLFPLVSSKHY